MNTIFDLILIHPSVVTNSNMVELALYIEDVLSANNTTSILLESPDNFLESNPLIKDYQELVRNLTIYTKQYTGRFFFVSGESMYSSAKRLLLTNFNICFIGFPYPELRSIYRLILDKKIENIKYASCDYNKKRGLSLIDLVKSNGKMTLEKSKINISNYLNIDCLDELECRGNYHQLESFDDAMTPSSYIYTFKAGKHRMIMKSPKNQYCPRDYLMKIEDLIDIRQFFLENSVKEALPQGIVYDGTTARGIIFNYIDGISFEKLYYDLRFQEFMEKNNYEASLANRIYLLVQLYAVVCEYHSMGIYFSDIKGDNFIVTNDCKIVPIDTDGFSYYKYYSSCPKENLVYPQETGLKPAFLQIKEIEQYSIMVITYCFLMDGHYPNSKNKKHISIKYINDTLNSNSAKETDNALVERWNQYPAYIRDVLYKGLAENKTCDSKTLLSLFTRFFLEITHSTNEEVYKWVFRKAEIKPFIEENIKKPLNLFNYIKIKELPYAERACSAERTEHDNKKRQSHHSGIDHERTFPEESKVTPPNSEKKEKTTVSNSSNSTQTKESIKTTSSSSSDSSNKSNHNSKRKAIVIAVLTIIALIGIYIACNKDVWMEIQGYVSTLMTVESGGFIDDLSMIRENVSITSTKETITANAGESVTITISAKGEIPDSIQYTVACIGDVSAEWGAWKDDNKSIPLTVTGTKSGQFVMRVCLYDADISESIAIAFKDINVNIN